MPVDSWPLSSEEISLLNERLPGQLEDVVALRRQSFRESPAVGLSYRARLEGRAVFIHLETDPAEHLRLSSALEVIESQAAQQHRVLPVPIELFDAQTGLLVVRDTGGTRFSDVLRKLPAGPVVDKSILDLFKQLGHFLKKLYQAGIRADVQQPASGFTARRVRLLAQRLEMAPFLGFLMFRGASRHAATLLDRYADLVHSGALSLGPGVLDRICIEGNKLRILDPIGSDPASHTLIDLYDIRLGVDGSHHSEETNLTWIQALLEGFGLNDFTESAHRVAFDIARHDWLSRHLEPRVSSLIDLVRGRFSFARPPVTDLAIRTESG